MIKYILSVLTLVAGIENSLCQVGIGTTSPDVSSVLDVSAENKGVLAPRLTTDQRNAIATPAKGLMLYNITEDCLEINTGTPDSPNWNCIGSNSLSTVINKCDLNGFEGVYVNGFGLTASNKFSVTVINNSFSTVTIAFNTSDLTLTGVSGISVTGVNTASATITPGGSELIEYTLSGTPTSLGELTGAWSKLGLNCTRTTNVVSGDAIFEIGQIITVVSVNDGAPVVDIQGEVNNTTNVYTINLPYTSGFGTYDAFTGTYIVNNTGTGEGGDANSFRLTYPAGTFSSSGHITATVEVDGDGSFNAEKQLLGAQKTIASLEFMVNGNDKGSVALDAIGGIPDRNFSDPQYKFIYLPVVAADGRTWLNNNLGAHYANMNNAAFNPVQQAAAISDYDAYGSLFQWGRYSDGHELTTWSSSSSGSPVLGGLTGINPTTDTPGHHYFVIEETHPSDWRVPQNNNLWQGENGINNPCPQGYRLPTENELSTLITSEGIISSADGLSSALAFSLPGYHSNSNGNTYEGNQKGYYLTSTVSGTNVRVSSIHAGFSNEIRARGHTVRCIKD